MTDIIKLDFLKDNPADILIQNSGGPDSAIIIWAVAKYIKENNLPINIFHTSIDSTEKFWYIHHAKQVINFVEKELGIPAAAHITQNDVVVTADENGNPVGYAEAQREVNTELLRNKHSIGYIMNGNSNMLAQKFLREAQEKDPEKYGHLHYTDTTRLMPEDGGTKIRQEFTELRRGRIKYEPFTNLDKRSVKECYDYYGVTDTLFPLTRSCEAEASNSQRYIGQEHCGKCIFCFERLAVFGRL